MLVSAFCPTPNPPLAKFKLAMECCLQIANILEYPLLDSNYPSFAFIILEIPGWQNWYSCSKVIDKDKLQQIEPFRCSRYYLELRMLIKDIQQALGKGQLCSSAVLEVIISEVMIIWMNQVKPLIVV